MPRPEAGERRATAEPVRYKPSRVPGGSPVIYQRGVNPLSNNSQQGNWMDNLKQSLEQARQAAQRGRMEQINQVLKQPFSLAGGQQNPFLPTNPTTTPAPWLTTQQYRGPYANQQQAGAPPVYTGKEFLGMISPQQTVADPWADFKRQQAAYHATINQQSKVPYYFGPGSMEQEYATRAYANAPIGIPTVPVDNTYYGGGYGGYGGGGGSGYAAPEADIPRWLYGMLNWRYR